jgi:hypothetical protein
LKREVEAPTAAVKEGKSRAAPRPRPRPGALPDFDPPDAQFYLIDRKARSRSKPTAPCKSLASSRDRKPVRVMLMPVSVSGTPIESRTADSGLSAVSLAICLDRTG